ncbi:hypothetical protein FXO38_26286 [Capsicum annuum]|nr:hypothetical protein FXO38_26286 [Capsicum annuum]
MLSTFLREDQRLVVILEQDRGVDSDPFALASISTDGVQQHEIQSTSSISISAAESHEHKLEFKSPYNPSLFHLQNISPKISQRRVAGKWSVPQPIQADPLDEHVSHAEFRAAFTTLAQLVAAQNARPIVFPSNPVANSAASRIREFTRMNPPSFFGSKSEEDTLEIAMLNSDMTLARLMTHAQQIEKQKIKMREKQNKKARIGSDVYFGYGKPGHRVRDCPQSSYQHQQNRSTAQTGRPNQQGATSSATSGQHPNRLYAFQSQQDQENSPDVVTGDFRISSKILVEALSISTLMVWRDSTSAFRGQLISYLRARKMISKGCVYHLVHVKDSSSESPSLESILVVNGYSDVFPKDLLGIPPKRKIDFGIDLLPDTQPISILPYRMAPAKLRELKK